MYHIKSDKRSRTSAEEIAAGLNRILKTEPLHTVTVTRIHQETGISRATFYRLFDTVEDVLIYQCDQLVDRAMDNYSIDHVSSPYESIRGIMAMGFEYHALIEALVANKRMDLIYEYTAKRLFTHQTIGPFIRPDMDVAAVEYFLSNISMAMVATLTTWTRRGRQESPEEVLHNNMHYWRFIRDLLENQTSRL